MPGLAIEFIDVCTFIHFFYYYTFDLNILYIISEWWWDGHELPTFNQ